MTMGTAATMMGIAEALGMTLPGASHSGGGRQPPAHGHANAAGASSTWSGKT
jgi:dihydroxyacid dehydratase/phosphogluconate dehydratase